MCTSVADAVRLPTAGHGDAHALSLSCDLHALSLELRLVSSSDPAASIKLSQGLNNLGHSGFKSSPRPYSLCS